MSLGECWSVIVSQCESRSAVFTILSPDGTLAWLDVARCMKIVRGGQRGSVSVSERQYISMKRPGLVSHQCEAFSDVTGMCFIRDAWAFSDFETSERRT